MTFRDAWVLGERTLCGIPDERNDALVLLTHCAGMSRANLLVRLEEEAEESVLKAYLAYLDRRRGREPLQYIMGSVPFLDCEIKVDARALIPRPETEFMTEAFVREVARLNLDEPRVLDLCTGSGAIAVSVKKALPCAAVHACDVSEEALALARENAQTNQTNVWFGLGDMFGAVGNNVYDAIISNPPYIRSTEIGSLQEEVRCEPILALDGGGDGLDFVRRIAAESPGRLSADGFVVVELGYDQAEAALVLFKKNYSEVEILKDLAGIPRVLDARGKLA